MTTRPASEIAAEWKSWSPQLRSVFRIVAAAMFIVAGTIKLFAFPIGVPPDGGTSPVLSQAWIGGVLEVVGGSLLLVGLFTRPVAFVISGEMAVAYLQFAAPQSFWPHVNMGMPAVLYCFLWLYYSAAGPGPWSLDALLGSRERSTELGRKTKEDSMARYVDGFVIPVPKKKVEEYRRIAKKAGKIWREHGALEYVETVGDDLKPRWGFPKLAKPRPGETIVFSWIVYKSRAHRDQVNAKVMKDPRLKPMMDPKAMPFDLKRMAYGGFKSIVEA